MGHGTWGMGHGPPGYGGTFVTRVQLHRRPSASSSQATKGDKKSFVPVEEHKKRDDESQLPSLVPAVATLTLKLDQMCTMASCGCGPRQPRPRVHTQCSARINPFLPPCPCPCPGPGPLPLPLPRAGSLSPACCLLPSVVTVEAG